MNGTLPYYEAVEDLRNVYLEDSFVLGIHETADSLFFDLDVVLTDDHPLYRPPPEDLRYCYRTARLVFSGDIQVTWVERNLEARNFDGMGNVDLGEIDGFECGPDGYYLDGEWGAVKVAAQKVELVFR